MPIFIVARDYMVWHYSRAYVDMLNLWWNYLWFINHFFSVPEVMGSWFAPFKRLQENKVSIFKSPQDFFGNLLVNVMMRIVGTVIRTAIIAMALIAFFFLFALGFLFMVLWSVLPPLVGYFFITSVWVFFL